MLNLALIGTGGISLKPQSSKFGQLHHMAWLIACGLTKIISGGPAVSLSRRSVTLYTDQAEM